MTAHRLRAVAAWNATLAAGLIAVAALLRLRDADAAAAAVYLAAIGLFHGIFAIWFTQGGRHPVFVRCTGVGRLLLAVAYLVVLARLLPEASSAGSVTAVEVLAVYLALESTALLVGGAVSALRPAAVPVPAPVPTPVPALGPAPVPDPAMPSPPRAELVNRALFAVYVVLIAGWILLGSGGFVGFFRLPQVDAADWPGLPAGPLVVVGLQLVLLGAYNAVAVTYRIGPLIRAGMRGGTAAFVSFAVLVVVGVLHPRALALPAIDLVSIAGLLVARFRGHHPTHS